MYQYTIVSTYTSPKPLTCEHCGRAIKSIVVIKDNATGITMNVGTTCINKIMTLNPSFEKALIKEIKKFQKIRSEYELYKDEQKYIEQKLSEGYLENTTWDSDIMAHRQLTMKDLESSAWFLHHNRENELKKAMKIMESLSKKGLIKLEDIL